MVRASQCNGRETVALTEQWWITTASGKNLARGRGASDSSQQHSLPHAILHVPELFLEQRHLQINQKSVMPIKTRASPCASILLKPAQPKRSGNKEGQKTLRTHVGADCMRLTRANALSQEKRFHPDAQCCFLHRARGRATHVTCHTSCTLNAARTISDCAWRSHRRACGLAWVRAPQHNDHQGFACATAVESARSLLLAPSEPLQILTVVLEHLPTTRRRPRN